MGTDPVMDLLVRIDKVTGLPPLGVLLARTGRLLGAVRDNGGSLFVAAFELAHLDFEGSLQEAMLLAAADALRSALRFDDPVARVGPEIFVVAAPLAPGASNGPETAAHLAQNVTEAVQAAVGGPDAFGIEVRHAHAVAVSPFPEEADQLVRRVVEEARGR